MTEVTEDKYCDLLRETGDNRVPPSSFRLEDDGSCETRISFLKFLVSHRILRVVKFVAALFVIHRG